MRRTSHILEGREAPAAYTFLVEQLAAIDEVNIVRIAPTPPLQKRIPIHDDENLLFSKAILIRAAIGIPFWDATMAALTSSEAPPLTVLDAALFHRSLRDIEMRVGREDVLNGILARMTRKHAQDAQEGSLSLLSEVVTTAGTRQHIPMLDFHCPPGGAQLSLVCGVVERVLGPPAIVLVSGASYHAVGLRLVDEDVLLRQLATALLFAPIVDRAWVAHQLLERRCALRFSRGGHTGAIPFVARVL